MRDKKTKAQIKKPMRWYPPPVLPPTPWSESTTPCLSHSPIVHNNNTMDSEFLVQRRQSNKCGKCKEWWNIQLTLGIWCRLLSQHPLPPGRHQPHLLIISAKAINPKKAKNPELRFNSQQIVSYCLGVCTHKSGLREVDLEPSPKRGSDKINMLNNAEKLKKKTISIIQPGLTNGSQHLVR